MNRPNFTWEELNAMSVALICRIKRDGKSLEQTIRLNEGNVLEEHDEWYKNYLTQEIVTAQSALDKLKEWY